MSTVLAIPSVMPGGLDAQPSPHFGHCDIYTLVTLDGDKIVSVSTLEAIPHAEGGCLRAVEHLHNHGVTALLAGGMGMRPLMGFGQLGIAVYRLGESANVKDAVEAYQKGSLPAFTAENACKGHH